MTPQNADGGGVGFLAPILAPNNERQEITFTGFDTGDNFKLTCPDGTQTEELTYVEGEPSASRSSRTASKKPVALRNVSLSGEPPNSRSPSKAPSAAPTSRR